MTTNEVWTEEDSKRIDMWALRAYTNPLQRDPHLWELLSEDRKAAPNKAKNRGRPLVCTDCRLQTYAHNQKPIDGGVMHHSRGLCKSCVTKRIEAGIPLPEPIRTVHTNWCSKCDKPIQHSHRGMCKSCYDKVRRPERCKGCSNPLRPAQRDVSEFPGTVRHYAHGRCRRCFERQRREQAAA